MSNGKTLLISGNQNGTGLAIALQYVDTCSHILFLLDKNESFDHAVFEKLKTGKANVLLRQINLCDENNVQEVIKEIEEQWGQIDTLINNIGTAFDLDTMHIHPQQFDAMYSLNVRSTFLLSKTCHSLLKKSSNPHIINISPPLDIEKKWFKEHLAFSMSTYGMSMCTLGMAAEFKKSGIAVNSLWSEHMFNKTNEAHKKLTHAAFLLSQKKSKACTGNFFLAETLSLSS